MNIFQVWERLHKLPGGKFLFGKFIARYVPYTGSVHPEVMELAPGFSRVRMQDRRAIRNHLNSIHAAALMNFSEFSTGIALISGLPTNVRAILVGFSIDYLKKARGTLTSECEAPVITSAESKEIFVECSLKDEKGDIVAKARARWRLGPNAKT